MWICETAADSTSPEPEQRHYKRRAPCCHCGSRHRIEWGIDVKFFLPCGAKAIAVYDTASNRLTMAYRQYKSNYEGRYINKLQNGAIPWVLKIGKIRNIRFVGNLILNIHTTFLDDDVIIVTSSDNRTQLVFVSFSPSVYYRNSQVINSIWTTEKKRKSLTC